ncbi:MAG: hypothetical protein H6648_01095 [Caldilineae bacterium]|nr:hypothetical protein [Chloroflexota bacterium]MCB9175726.1 hypothetical protein [Caldilineae bacterium]
MPTLDPLFTTSASTRLSDGEKRAIVQMFAHGSSIPDLASWYKVTQADIREVLKPHVQFVNQGRSR